MTLLKEMAKNASLGVYVSLGSAVRMLRPFDKIVTFAE